MDQDPKLAERITAKIVERMERSKAPIPVGVSNRHLHLTQEHWEILFGKGTQPRRFRAVKQPGFWAAYETVDVEGPKGRIEKVRLVAPYRSRTQIEISRTDAAELGLRPPVRESGKLDGSAPARLKGPKGTLEIKEGVIIAQRHVHFHPTEAQAMGVKDGEIVRVRAGMGGPRPAVFEDVLVRVSDKYSLEFHVDTDEANAAWLKTGDLVYIV